ncbi:MAG: DVUA0089 family protein [Spongiibacteraceae bacterium]
MMQLRLKTLIFTWLTFASLSVSAGIIESTISYDFNEPSGKNNLDAWHFNLATDGMVSFDILAHELDPLNGPDPFTYTWVDLNNDGDEDYLDSMIWLFHDDGALSWDDLISSNDDSGFGDDTNNSLADHARLTHSLDPFISNHLVAGDYILMVGSCCGNSMDLSTLTQDVGFDNYHPATGDYQLHYSENLSLVSVAEPSSIWAAVALIGFLSRFRRKNLTTTA